MRRCFGGCIILIGVMLIASVASSTVEPYPTRPIVTIVPQLAGGGTDGAARVIAEVLAKYLGQPAIVENKPGAGGTLGASYVAKAKPDGYIVGHLTATATLPECFKAIFKTDYTSQDFIPIAQFSALLPTVICRADKPYKTFKELIEYAKKSDQVLYGSPGRGTSNELALMLVEKTEGIQKFKYVPFSGDANTMNALLGGHIDVGSVTFNVAVPLTKSGKIRMLAIIPENKMPGYDVPNFYELGYNTGFRQFYIATFAPKGTPEYIINKLEKAIEQSTKDPLFKTRMENIMMPITYRNSKQLAALVDQLRELYFDLDKKNILKYD